jgi:hypothetical protein
MVMAVDFVMIFFPIHTLAFVTAWRNVAKLCALK